MLVTWASSQGLFNQASFLLNFTDLGAGLIDTSASRGGVPATFTRATIAQSLLGGANSGKFGQAASGAARSWYSNSGLTLLGYMPEGARTNRCVRSQSFSADWVSIGTPTLVSATTVLGSVQLDTIGDDDAGALEGFSLPVVFVGDAVKSCGVFMKAGTSTSSVVRLRDGTAAADVLLAAITWAGGAPTIAMTTGTDLTGTVSAAQLGTSGVFWIKFTTTAVTAASANQLEVYPATDAALNVGGTGTVEVGVVNEEDATFPSSPIITTGAAVTRNADVLTYPLAPWYNAAVGTFFAQVQANWSAATGGTHTLLTAGAGTAFFFNPNNAPTQIRAVDGTNTVTKSGLNNYNTAVGKFSTAYDAGGIAVTGSGLAPQAGSFDGDFGSTSLAVSDGTNSWFGTISRIAYFPVRFPNQYLQTMTQ